MHYTYVLRSEKDSRLYTGSTNDLRRRLSEHNHGKVSSTKHREPFKLIYYEACINEQDARAREKYLKTGMGKRYLKNRLKRFLSSNGVNDADRKAEEEDRIRVQRTQRPVWQKNQENGGVRAGPSSRVQVLLGVEYPEPFVWTEQTGFYGTKTHRSGHMTIRP